MNTSFAIELHRRATHALQTGLADADTQDGQVAVSQYTSDEQTTQELRLLRQFPQPVAGSSSIPTPGAWLSLTPFDVPLLLVRQSDGAVHAFLNVCRHRGARVVAEGSGTEARAFTCPYHAWTYQPDGDLRAVPDAFGFPRLKKEKSGLKRLAAVERGGFIWVVLDPASPSEISTHTWARSWRTWSRWTGSTPPCPMRSARSKSTPTGSC